MSMHSSKPVDLPVTQTTNKRVNTPRVMSMVMLLYHYLASLYSIIYYHVLHKKYPDFCT